MGYFATFQTITNSKDQTWFQIETDGLYETNVLGHRVKSPDLIYQACIFNENVVFLTDHRYRNNIAAYDFQGNFLWNIENITGDIKMPFTYLSCVFKADAERALRMRLPGHAKIILECIAAGIMYIVDPEKRQLLCRLPCKVK